MTESFVQAILQAIRGELRKQKIKISRPIIEMTQKFSYHPPNTSVPRSPQILQLASTGHQNTENRGVTCFYI